MKFCLALFFISMTCWRVTAQNSLITDVDSRKSISLNGAWQYIADPYETGFYDYRYKELKENDPEAYWNLGIPGSKTDKEEHGYSPKYSLQVPGDWNHQKPEFLYYEGTIWYKKSFDVPDIDWKKRYFIYFGAVNYRADVYLNGRKLGMHIGGFTPFNFEIPASLLRKNDNFLVVKVDNKRGEDEVPTLNTDWWNYGGITRDVRLLELPEHFIQDYVVQLKKPEPGKSPNPSPVVQGWIKFNRNIPGGKVVVHIPELEINKDFSITGDSIPVFFKLSHPQLWSPQSPKLYEVIITSPEDTLNDKIGFRTIEAYGKRVLLNGKPIFLRGISIHGEIPEDMRRAYGRSDAIDLLNKARDLGCNMVRLAHYPHDEAMTRMTDSLGILVWSEIPVYWTVDFGSKEVFNKAKAQLTEMITRDRNKASVIIWSVGNETPVSQVRTDFMHGLIKEAKRLDSTRMVSAALEVNYSALNKINEVNDPLGQFVDLVAFNEYLGWYGGLPDKCRTTNWSTPYDKPLFISETGAGAKGGFHADSLTRFSEEFQAWYFKEQIAMFSRMPENFVGLSPWILNDFRSPKRNNPNFQEGWNRKGLVDEHGNKKLAFYVLQAYYNTIKQSTTNK